MTLQDVFGLVLCSSNLVLSLWVIDTEDVRKGTGYVSLSAFTRLVAPHKRKSAMVRESEPRLLVSKGEKSEERLEDVGGGRGPRRTEESENLFLLGS